MSVIHLGYNCLNLFDMLDYELDRVYHRGIDHEYKLPNKAILAQYRSPNYDELHYLCIRTNPKEDKRII